MNDEEFTEDQLKELMHKKQGDKSYTQFARDIGCSTAYICDVYAGNRGAGPRILNYLGLEKKVTYRKWRKEDE
jgi:hypothetical protein